MTREHAKSMLPIIEAFSNGEKVQISRHKDEWVECENIDFNLDLDKYRIKPEPKFIPLSFEEAKKILCVDVIAKGGDMVQGQIHVVAIGLDGVYLRNLKDFEWFISYQDLFDKYLFSPTEPCGKIIN